MKLLDSVQLARDMRVTVDLPQGFRGVIVDEGGAVLANGVRNFLVEFCDDEGRGFILHLAEGEIHPAESKP